MSASGVSSTLSLPRPIHEDCFYCKKPIETIDKVEEFASIIHLVCGHRLHDACHDTMVGDKDSIYCRIHGLTSDVETDVSLQESMCYVEGEGDLELGGKTYEFWQFQTDGLDKELLYFIYPAEDFLSEKIANLCHSAKHICGEDLGLRTLYLRSHRLRLLSFNKGYLKAVSEEMRKSGYELTKTHQFKSLFYKPMAAQLTGQKNIYLGVPDSDNTFDFELRRSKSDEKKGT